MKGSITSGLMETRLSRRAPGHVRGADGACADAPSDRRATCPFSVGQAITFEFATFRRWRLPALFRGDALGMSDSVLMPTCPGLFCFHGPATMAFASRWRRDKVNLLSSFWAATALAIFKSPMARIRAPQQAEYLCFSIFFGSIRKLLAGPCYKGCCISPLRESIAYEVNITSARAIVNKGKRKRR